MRRRPVVGLGRVDEDVAVLAELLAVVLADVRVVPVGAGIGEGDPVGEPAADRDRRLRLVRAVVAVLQAQTVPVDGRLEVALVDDVHDELRALRHAQRRAGDGAVVGDHAHGVVADPLRDRRDPQLERVAVGELHDLGRRRLREAGGVGRERARSPRWRRGRGDARGAPCYLICRASGSATPARSLLRLARSPLPDLRPIFSALARLARSSRCCGSALALARPALGARCLYAASARASLPAAHLSPVSPVARLPLSRSPRAPSAARLCGRLPRLRPVARLRFSSLSRLSLSATAPSRAPSRASCRVASARSRIRGPALFRLFLG